MFAAEFEPASSGVARRGAARATVSLDAGIEPDCSARTLCKVTDVSTHGARLQTYSGLKQGTRIWLTLPKLGQIVATIMWADDFEAGCMFQNVLDDASFETLTSATA